MFSRPAQPCGTIRLLASHTLKPTIGYEKCGLATQLFWGGITTVLTGGLSYAIRTIDDYTIHAVLVARIGVVPVQALWATAVAALLWLVLNRHRFGEHLLFIGDNVSVARVLASTWCARRSSCSQLWACGGVIGGTSIFGGKATIVGTYVGAYIIGMIEAGLVATGIQGFWVRIVVGLVFLAAVIFHLTMDDPVRLRRLRNFRPGGRLEPPAAPPAQEPP